MYDIYVILSKAISKQKKETKEREIKSEKYSLLQLIVQGKFKVAEDVAVEKPPWL